MKVKDLIEELKEVDEELTVFIMGDAKGNYSNEMPSDGVVVSSYNDMFIDKMPIHPDDIEDHDKRDVKKGLFLWP